jgi:hypothetical protein
MKKITHLILVAIVSTLLFSCKQEDVVTLDNPNVVSVQLDSTLGSYYPKPTATLTNFKNMYSYEFPNLDCMFSINMNWFNTSDSDGVYFHFNNTIGDVLVDGNGFVKSFNSGVKIDSTLSGTWSGYGDGRLSYDYALYPSANKGNLAGQGDKYIIFRAFSGALPALKYYGYVRLSVSANGRDLKIINIAYQKNPNTSFTTGEY